jgi:hypothetical protein
MMPEKKHPPQVANCPKCGSPIDELRQCPKCGYKRRGRKPKPRGPILTLPSPEPSTPQPEVTKEVNPIAELRDDIKELKEILHKHRHDPAGNVVLPWEE